MALDRMKGKSLWFEGEYKSSLAQKYREAAAATEEVDEKEMAEELRKKASEAEYAAVHMFSSAKALGFFGEGK